MLTLYHVPLSPFCRKVRLSLAEKRIECQLVEERYWDRDPDFLRRNPAGKVPVLKVDGRFMAESAAICEWIEEMHPTPSLMPATPDERAEVRRLVCWFDDKFHSEVTTNLLGERVNKKLMKQGYPESKNIKAGSQKIKFHLDYMAWLLDHRRWLASGRFLPMWCRVFCRRRIMPTSISDRSGRVEGRVRAPRGGTTASRKNGVTN